MIFLKKKIICYIFFFGVYFFNLNESYHPLFFAFLI